MKMSAYLLAAACLCTSATMFAFNAHAADIGQNASPSALEATSTGNAGRLNFPPGIQEKQMHEKNSIQNAFESVTESAFTKKGFSDVIDVLCDQDRTRLEKDKASTDNSSNDALSQKMKQLKEAWKSKYNHDFNIKNKNVYDNYLNFRTGEINDPNQLVGKWPLPAGGESANRGGEASQQDIQDTEKHAFGGDVNLEKGRDVAVAELPGQNGLAPLTASLIHEAGGWKFDIPNNISRQQLHQALLTNLSYLYDHRDQWPSDVNAGYREATYSVVSALYNVQSGMANQARMMNENANPTANNR